MNLSIRIRRQGVFWRNALYTLLIDLCWKKGKTNNDENFVFLIGCGRSGTTFLTKALGGNDQILYLNERREIWHRFFPELNIWSSQKGQLGVTFHKSYNNEKASRMAAYLDKALNCKRKQVLLEKLPINTFRIAFLKAAFPRAKFIYIERNGMSVAHSIANLVENGWWGRDNSKWKLLESFARQTEPYRNLLSLLRNEVDKGLLEWRISTDLAHDNLSRNDINVHWINYEELVRNTSQTLSSCLHFMHLAPDESQLENIEVRNMEIVEITTDEVHEKIGGTLLIKQLEQFNDLGYVRWRRIAGE